MANPNYKDLLGPALATWDEDDREDDRKEQKYKSRRGIAGGLKKLSKSGQLTGDLLKQARNRATEAGVTDEQFASFMGKNSIRQNATPETVVGSTPIQAPPKDGKPAIPATPAFSFSSGEKSSEVDYARSYLNAQDPEDLPATMGSAPISTPTKPDTLKQAATAVRATGASSPEEATQKVMSERNFGTGLGALEAMQDPKYVLGSGSSLSEPARSIGPESGKYRRAARRLTRKGYRAQAAQMALQGEMIRVGEPAIDTEELRAQRSSQKMLVGREAMKQDKVLADLDQRDKALKFLGINKEDYESTYGNGGIGKPKIPDESNIPNTSGVWRGPQYYRKPPPPTQNGILDEFNIAINGTGYGTGL